METHGGRIWAESDGPGAGVCFTFTLPSVEESEGGAVGRYPPVSTRREDKEGDGRVRVLAVDDDPRTSATSATPSPSRATTRS